MLNFGSYSLVAVYMSEIFFGGQLGLVCQFPFIREAFDPQYSPKPSLLLLKVEVSSGTGGITRIFPRSPGFATSLDCPFDSTRLTRQFLSDLVNLPLPIGESVEI